MTIRFLTDENFNGRVIRGVLRALPVLDLLRVQDTALYEAPDPDVLAWAAEQDRIILTHDIATMLGFAYARVRAKKPMPGVIAVRDSLPVGQVIDDLIIIAEASTPADWENRVFFLPL